MPSVSEAQARLMRAVAHGWRKPGGGGPPVSVAKDFVAADQAKKRNRGGSIEAALHEARRYGKKYGGAVDRKHDIPYLAGISKNNKCLYIDRRFPKTLTVKGRTFDPAKYLRVHETHEHKLMTKHGWPYEKAHQSATEKEKAAVKADGIDWNGYEAEMRGYANETEHEKYVKKPKNLYLGPYKKAGGGEVPSNMVSDEDLSVAEINKQEAAKQPRQGGLMQTIPQGWEAMQTPEGRSDLAKAAGMWWRGDTPGEPPQEDRSWTDTVAANPLVKPVIEMVKGPHEAMTGQMTPEQEADWGAGTALGMIGVGSVRGIKSGELGAAGSKPMPEKYKNPYDIDPADIKQFKQESGPLGSNPGGLFRDKEGQQWYIKTPQTYDHALNEKLASELYKLAGVPIAEVNLTKLNGKPAVASKIIEGEQLGEVFGKKPVNFTDLREHFPADAWLANYDSVGTGKDNVIVDANGKAHRIDMGGALRYRAQGKPKTDWGPDLKELESMRDPNINRDAADIFGDGALPGELTAQKIVQIPGEKIAELVERYGPNSQSAKTKLVADLVARQQQIAKEYGIGQEPSSGGTGPTGQAKEAAVHLAENYGPKDIAQHLHEIANENGPHVAEAIFRELPDIIKQEVDANIRKLTQQKHGSTADELEQLINSQGEEIPYDTSVPPPYGEIYEGYGSREELSKKFDEFAKPLKWEEYTPLKKQTGLEPLSTALPPEELKKLGFNPDVPLFKGGFEWHPDKGELPDPTWKPNEKANFLSDHPGIAGWYGDVQSYVARAPKAMEINWPEITGSYEYLGWAMDQLIHEARQRGQDLLVIHGIDDVGGRNQTQYAFLNPAALRSPKAKFDPDKLHLRLPHAGLVGGGLFGYGLLKGQKEDDNKMASGGKVDNWVMHQASRNLHSEGLTHSTVPGRTDKLPRALPAGAYVLPAETVSALGQNNTLAGGAIAKSMFSKAPLGMAPMKGSGRVSQPKLRFKAEGGETEGEETVPTVLAGGEFIIHPDVVKEIGHGSLTAGHKVLDQFVLKVRKEHIKTIKALKPPKR